MQKTIEMIVIFCATSWESIHVKQQQLSHVSFIIKQKVLS